MPSVFSFTSRGEVFFLSDFFIRHGRAVWLYREKDRKIKAEKVRTEGQWQGAQWRQKIAIVRVHSDSSEAEATDRHLDSVALSSQSRIVFDFLTIVFISP